MGIQLFLLDHVGSHDASADPQTAASISACAQIRALRELIGIHSKRTVKALLYAGPETYTRCAECSGNAYPCRTLRVLASVYSAEPDFLPEWAG